MTIAGSPGLVTTLQLNQGYEEVIEAQMIHSTNDLTLIFSFGTLTETCRKMLQDISVFYYQCHDYCGSNNCPTVEPYYKHINLLQCVSNCSPAYSDPTTKNCVADCPFGYN